MEESKRDRSMSKTLQDIKNFTSEDKEESVTKRATPKTEACKYHYHASPGGCRRAVKCNGGEGLGQGKPASAEQGNLSLPQGKLKSIGKPRDSEDLHRKIFVGGLPPSLDSDELKKFFDYMFGPVEDAAVILNQEGSRSQSRGFGFITFKHQDSAAEAIDAHYVIIFGKKVEIKGAVPKPIPLLDSDTSLHSPKVSLPTATEADIPPWVSVFRQWFPGFLAEATKRLGEGEWYPLSQLKSDFRATCGLELDHTSLGYLKLSDFMACFPGLCCMKMVPTGWAPATHMVLLPFPPTGGGHNSEEADDHVECSFEPEKQTALPGDLQPPSALGKPTPPMEVQPGLLDFLWRQRGAPSPFIPFSIWSFGLPTANNDNSSGFSLFHREFDYYEKMRTRRLSENARRLITFL